MLYPRFRHVPHQEIAMARPQVITRHDAGRIARERAPRARCVRHEGDWSHYQTARDGVWIDINRRYGSVAVFVPAVAAKSGSITRRQQADRIANGAKPGARFVRRRRVLGEEGEMWVWDYVAPGVNLTVDSDGCLAIDEELPVPAT
jgi:hypothetical protein